MKNKYTEKQKLARKIWRELDALYEKTRKLGYHKLDKPVQKGWIKQFKVREDILRSSEGKRFLEILPYVQNSHISRTTDFTEVTKLRGELGLRVIRVKNKENVPFPEYYWEKYFYLTRDYKDYYYTGMGIEYQNVFSIKREYAFETEIKPYFIDRLPIIDPAIKSRIKELENYIEKNQLWPIIDKIFGWRKNYRDNDSQKMLIRTLEKELREELSNG